MAIRARTSLSLKPPLGARINPAHPLAPGLALDWACNECGGLYLRNGAGSSNYDGVVASTDFAWASGLKGTNVSRGAGVTTNKITLNAALASGTTFTIAMRVYLIGVKVDNYGSVFCNSGGSAGLFLHLSAGSYFLDWFQGTDHNSAVGATLNGWNDLVFSCLGGTGTFFINSALPDANTVASVTTQSLIAVMSNASAEYINGNLDYLRVWLGRALNPAEVRILRSDPWGLYQFGQRRSYKTIASANGFFELTGGGGGLAGERGLLAGVGGGLAA